MHAQNGSNPGCSAIPAAVIGIFKLNMQFNINATGSRQPFIYHMYTRNSSQSSTAMKVSENIFILQQKRNKRTTHTVK